MAIVRRDILVAKAGLSDTLKPTKKPDGVTNTDKFPTGLRYIVCVIKDGGTLAPLETRGANAADPAYCYDKINVNIDETIITACSRGHYAYRDSDGAHILLDVQYHIDRDFP